MKVAIFSLSIIFSVLMFGNIGCIEPINTENSKITEQNRLVEKFSAVKFAVPCELILTQADSFAVIIEAPEKIIKKIKIEVKNDKLIIKTNKRIRDSKNIKIFVYAANLEQIEVAGSGNIYQANTWNFNNLNLLISGSGNISLENAIINGDLENIVNGSGNINLTDIYDLKNMNNKIDGSGNINISTKTKCEINNIKISGSGNVIAFNVFSNKSIVEIKGSGDAKINVISDLTIDIMGSGNVHYTGNPNIHINKKGSGEVIKVN